VKIRLEDSKTDRGLILARRRVPVKKGLLTNEEVLEEIKVVRREMEGKQGK